jgi:predicted NUDIX family NTP pyrophosphohydrolase
MEKKISAGLLMYRFRNHTLEVLLAHPGGPFFRNKDNGHWSIPKGEIDGGEELIDTAVREFREETGLKPEGPYIPLGSIVQKGGKKVFAWAFEGRLEPMDPNPANTFETEWPPHSRKKMMFLEIDKVEYFTTDTAKTKIKNTQIAFIERLEEYLHLK